MNLQTKLFFYQSMDPIEPIDLKIHGKQLPPIPPKKNVTLNLESWYIPHHKKPPNPRNLPTNVESSDPQPDIPKILLSPPETNQNVPNTPNPMLRQQQHQDTSNLMLRQEQHPNHSILKVPRPQKSEESSNQEVTPKPSPSRSPLGGVKPPNPNDEVALTVRGYDEVENSLSKTRLAWIWFSGLLTFYISDCFLLCCLKTEEQRQAVREKIAILTILLLVSLLFIGIYVFIPLIICHEPDLKPFNTLIDKKSTFCFWFKITLFAFFGIIGLIVALKVICAMGLMCNTSKRKSKRDPYIIINIPCYTEGIESMQKTIQSAAQIFYPNRQKLLLIVCDGMVTGRGNSKSTPEIVLEILGRNINDSPDAFQYKSLNGRNRAKVFTGYYRPKEEVTNWRGPSGDAIRNAENADGVPYMVIVKSGLENERNKPGNRGKRDSQLVVLSFLHRLFYGKKLSPLEEKMKYDMETILGIDPNRYELMLTIDSDTIVSANCLDKMVPSFEDPRVVAVCGETRIGNPGSVIGAIQVYEYYINHHLNKAFESVLDTVTCLPGCFSLYRIKTLPKSEKNTFGAIRGPKEKQELELRHTKDTQPVESKPYLILDSIIKSYSNKNLDSLHIKNLLSLGEDRFLTLLLLRFFPEGKTKFIPQAKCWTTVPDSFCVLLSQRRRWINSTIHNLVELLRFTLHKGISGLLIKVFVVIDLISTFLLPISILYLAYLIFVTIYFKLAIPWMLIGSVGLIFGSQFLLICIRRDFSYLLWFIPYFLAIPIWYILMPIYALYKMDDVSWGSTRQTTGTIRQGH